MPNKPLKLLMKRIRRRLDKYVDLEATHCGHEDLVIKALDERDKFFDWLEAEIETRTKSAIAEDVMLNRGPG